MFKYEDLLIAQEMAMNAHEGQKYGKRDYYFGHICLVEDKVRSMFGDDSDLTLRIIAVQHDMIEDSNRYTFGDIRRVFGDKVADAVVAITKFEGESRNDYIERVKQNELALKVKICDTICNLEESIKIQDAKRIVRYSEQLSKLYK